MSDEIYVKTNIPVFEAVYEKGFISLGGSEAALKIFENLDLKNKHLLDIGFGIGGMAHVLASKYHSRVTGIELQEWMCDYAYESASQSIQNLLSFYTYKEDGSFPIESESIDLAYSKGVLTNIEDKASLFLEVHRVLKKGAQICFVDWLVPDSQGAQSEILHMGDASHKECPSTYKKLLTECGFKNLSFEDVSEEYLAYVRDLDEKLRSSKHKQLFKEVLDSDLRKELITSNQKLMSSIESGVLKSMRIRGRKV